MRNQQQSPGKDSSAMQSWDLAHNQYSVTGAGWGGGKLVEGEQQVGHVTGMLEWNVLPSTCEVLPGTSDKIDGGPLAINIYRLMIPIIPCRDACMCVDHEGQNGAEIKNKMEICLNIPNN